MPQMVSWEQFKDQWLTSDFILILELDFSNKPVQIDPRWPQGLNWFETVKSQAYNNFNSDGNIILAPNGTNNYHGAHLSLQVQFVYTKLCSKKVKLSYFLF